MFARESEFLRHSSNIDLFSDQVENRNIKTVFVDEVQRTPSLLNTIQAIDESKGKRNLRFFLSGSSARKLRRGQATIK
jgi:predicted AAA+ superfamily ATPase